MKLGRKRRLAIFGPWSEDVREYGAPVEVLYFGPRYHAGFRPFDGYQQYNWEHGHWDGIAPGRPYRTRRWFTAPTDAEQRLNRATCSCAREFKAWLDSR